MSEVTVYEAPHLRVARALRGKGYQIGYFGVRTDEPDSRIVSVLVPREPVERSFLWMRWKQRQPGLYVGDLWLDNPPRKATPDQHWVLEVQGRDYLEELTAVSRELSDAIGASVEVKLLWEHPGLEREPRRGGGSGGAF